MRAENWKTQALREALANEYIGPAKRRTIETELSWRQFELAQRANCEEFDVTHCGGSRD